MSIAPHPDDELLGAPALLMALRDAGWRVVNFACSLGRADDHERRRSELARACELAGFDLLVPDDLPPIGRADDLAVAQDVLTAAIEAEIGRTGPQLLVGPSPHDGHHAHEVVGRAIVEATEHVGRPARVMFWGLWADLPFPTALVGFDSARLHEIERALRAHAGELARNRFDRLLAGRAVANSVLGPERVFGWDTPGSREDGGDYAELLCETSWSPSVGWRLGNAQRLTPAALDAAALDADLQGPELDWWLHAASAHERLDSASSRS
jgi:LmbE family N-acetylglucosaminyl deacetylase